MAHPGRPTVAFLVSILVLVSVTPAAGTAPRPDAVPQPDAAPRQDAATEIDSCTTLDDPGRYVLTENVTNASATENTGIDAGNDTVHACVVVTSSDVVLDGAGHAVDGKGFANATGNDTRAGNDTDSFDETERSQFPTGIAVRSPNGTPLRNVTVTNVTTTDWFIGVLSVNVTDAAITDVTANENANLGFELLGLHDSTVANNTANRNPFAGLYAATSTNNTIAGNRFVDNTIAGIDLFYANDNNTLRDNVVAGSDVAGIAVIQSRGNRLVGNTISNTTGDESLFGFSGGVVLVSAPETHLVNTTASDNRQWTVYAADCATAAGTCLEFDANRSGPTTVTAEGLELGSRTLSFRGRNVALGTGGERRGGRSLGDGLFVTNTSQDAYLELQTHWDGATASGSIGNVSAA